MAQSPKPRLMANRFGAAVPNLATRIDSERDWEDIEEAMTRIVRRVAKRVLTVETRWLIHFAEKQANGSIQIAIVEEPMSMIVFESGILGAGRPTRLTKMGLRSRIQASLTHAIVEGNSALQLGVQPGQRVAFTHQLASQSAPLSDIAGGIDRVALSYLRMWAAQANVPAP